MAELRMRTVRQCATFFKEQDPDSCIGEWCIRKLVNEGKIPVRYSGKKVLINLDMLIGYYATGETDQETEPATVTRIH